MKNIEDYRDILDAVQIDLGVSFNDPELLFRCLVHDSYAYENEEITRSNERLEFLGDSVLGLVISHLLYAGHPQWNEGELALYKSHLVSAEYLASRARAIDFGQYLLLGRGEDGSGGRQRTSILSDCLEAFIGAVYLDQGFDVIFDFIRRLFEGCLDEKIPPKDYKSCLQEYSQKQFKALPHYEVIDESGPPHRKTFHVRVQLPLDMEGMGQGSSKKDAEQNAARQVMEDILRNSNDSSQEDGPGEND